MLDIYIYIYIYMQRSIRKTDLKKRDGASEKAE